MEMAPTLKPSPMRWMTSCSVLAPVDARYRSDQDNFDTTADQCGHGAP